MNINGLKPGGVKQTLPSLTDKQKLELEQTQKNGRAQAKDPLVTNMEAMDTQPADESTFAANLDAAQVATSGVAGTQSLHGHDKVEPSTSTDEIPPADKNKQVQKAIAGLVDAATQQLQEFLAERADLHAQQPPPKPELVAAMQQRGEKLLDTIRERFKTDIPKLYGEHLGEGVEPDGKTAALSQFLMKDLWDGLDQMKGNIKEQLEAEQARKQQTAKPGEPTALTPEEIATVHVRCLLLYLKNLHKTLQEKGVFEQTELDHLVATAEYLAKLQQALIPPPVPMAATAAAAAASAPDTAAATTPAATAGADAGDRAAPDVAGLEDDDAQVPEDPANVADQQVPPDVA